MDQMEVDNFDAELAAMMSDSTQEAQKSITSNILGH